MKKIFLSRFIVNSGYEAYHSVSRSIFFDFLNEEEKIQKNHLTQAV